MNYHYQCINRALNRTVRKRVCFLLTTNRMIAKNRSHNHVKELQFFFCKLIVIFFFFFFLPTHL